MPDPASVRAAGQAGAEVCRPSCRIGPILKRCIRKRVVAGRHPDPSLIVDLAELEVPVPDCEPLSVEDRFQIYEQMNLHQIIIDTGWGREQAQAYVGLYWPEGKFTVIDLRHQTFEGHDALKQMYDYGHSVFPLDKWSHDMGPFRIEGGGGRATVHWRWVVKWRREIQGTVSTGTYDDVFEKRDGIWKCLERTRRSTRTGLLRRFNPMSTGRTSCSAPRDRPACLEVQRMAVLATGAGSDRGETAP